MADLAYDQRLRPAVEANSAIVAGLCAGVALAAPWALMLPPALGAVAGVCAGGFAWHRWRQAWSIISYRWGLKNYRLTKLAPTKVPGDAEKFYLGQGFEWGQQHTQRKVDATLPEVAEFLKPTREVKALTGPVRRFEAWVDTWGKTHKGPLVQAARLAASFTSATEAWNPVYPRVDLGGSPILHGVEPNEVPIFLRQNQRTGHMIVLGTTRVGKTRLLEMLATQDIHAGHVVIVIDPKGDADLMLRMYAEAARAGRLHHFYMFHLGYPEISARYNGIGSFSRITEVATRATNALPSSGNSAAFKEFSWRFSNIVAQAQVALGRVPTYKDLLRDVTNIEPLFLDYARLILQREQDAGRLRAWEARRDGIESQLADKKNGGLPVPRAMQDRNPSVVATFLLVRELRLPDAVLDGLAQAVAYDRSFYEKIIASLGPFLEKLTTGNVGKLISPDYFDPDDKRPIFDWLTVMRQGGMVYCGLDALSDAVIAGAVGNSMLADLVSVGGKLYKEGLDPHRPDGKLILPTVCAHLDEVNEIAGPEFVPMVNKMGGSGLRVTAYTQTIPDIEAKVGDAAKAKQVLGNFNHVAMLRVRDLETAKFFTEQLPEVDVVSLTAVSGVTDTAADGAGKHFVSNNQDRVARTKVPMLVPADLMQLPQGQAFVLREGNRLAKIRIPLPDAANDAFIPPSLRAVGEKMRSRYRSSEHWAQETDWLSDHPIGLTHAVVPPEPAVPSDGAGLSDVDLPRMADLGPIPVAESANATGNDHADEPEGVA